jgi:hypothetical protein
MMASATNGTASGSSGSASVAAGQLDFMISSTILVFSGISLGFMASPHTDPPVCTIHCDNCLGSPAIGSTNVCIEQSELRTEITVSDTWRQYGICIRKERKKRHTYRTQYPCS